MKRIIYLFCFLLLSFSTVIGQDWTTENDKLYYLTKEGKVYIEADYSAMAVYFKGKPSTKAVARFSEKLKTRSSEAITEEAIQMMDLKEMIQLKSTKGISAIKTPEDRSAFLTEYDLEDENAYEVLPAFLVGETQAWLTKQVIVRLKEGNGLSQIEDIMAKYNASFVKNITDENTFVLKTDQIENQLSLIQEVNDQGLLDWGEPDFKMEIVRRNDPYYEYQWHLNNTGGVDYGGKVLLNDADIDAPEAWEIATGNNVTVAVIDDGLENHEDMATLLQGYTPANGGNGTPSLSTDGHGQQCAGLIGALHNDIGVRGVAPGVRMFSVNIFAPNTSNSDVAVGIDWAVDNGADVLTNSWGYTSCNTNISSITSAFQNAATNGRGGLGCIILVASGNDFASCVSYPANLSTVTAVGGISGDGARSNFSNYGPTLDLVAPSNDDWVFNNAGQLISASHGLVTVDREGNDGWYTNSNSSDSDYSFGFGGTSGATPIAAGVAALVLSVDPSLTKSEVENILYSTADDIGPSGFDNEYGNGRVNAYQAVLAASGGSDGGGSTCSLTAPANFSASNIGNTSFTLSWTEIPVAASYTISIGGVSTTVTGTSYTTNGLSQGTSYVCSIVANCIGGGNGAPGVITVTTTGTGSNPSASVVLVESGFDTGFEGFIDGGANASWYSGTGYMASAPFVYIGDDTNTSLIASPTFNASSYDQVYLEFDLQFYQMEGTDGLDVSFYNGSSWIYLGSISVSEFGNESTISVSGAINSSEYNLPTNAQILFEGSGSVSSDYSFIDNVVITGNSGDAVVSSLTTSSLQANNKKASLSTALPSGLLEGQVSIFPNPSTDIVNVNNFPLNGQVKLLDMSGKVLIETDRASLDISGQKNGIYFLDIISEGESLNKIKFIKK